MTIVRKLARELWLIPEDLDDNQLQAYREHIRECRKVKDDTAIPCGRLPEVLKLADAVSSCTAMSLSDTYDELRKQYQPNPSQSQINESSIQQALEFIVRLCYFVPLTTDLRKGQQTIQDALHNALPAQTNGVQGRRLNEEFCEKNLSRIANLKFRPTSDLRRHLELKGREVLVFRHGTALKAYEADSAT